MFSVFFLRRMTQALIMISLSLGAKALAQSNSSVSDLQILLMAQNYRLHEVAQAKKIEDKIISEDGTFRTRLIVLEHTPVGRLHMKLREPVQAGQYPVLFMTTGLHAGMDSLEFVKINAPVILVAFEYPIDRNAQGADFVLSVLNGILPMQGQLVVALNWLKNQPQVRADRINILNVSFGTFATPLAQRVARLLGVEIYSTIYAFGGADPMQLILPELNRQVSSKISQADYQSLVSTLSRITDILDSRHHLPHLSGRFLVIQGLRDELIPASSTMALFESLPAPKSIIELDLPHISSDRLDVIKATSETAARWLYDQGALN